MELKEFGVRTRPYEERVLQGAVLNGDALAWNSLVWSLIPSADRLVTERPVPGQTPNEHFSNFFLSMMLTLQEKSSTHYQRLRATVELKFLDQVKCYDRSLKCGTLERSFDYDTTMNMLERLTKELGRFPTAEELAKEAGCSKKSARCRMNRVLFPRPSNHIVYSKDAKLDEPAPESDNPIYALIMKEDGEQLPSLLAKLKPREIDIIYRSFGLKGTDCWSTEKLARKYGCSNTRIKQIRKKALGKLRMGFEEIDSPVPYAKSN